LDTIHLLLWLALGLAGLAIGGDLLVRGSVRAADRLGASPLLAGLVLVGFGTSTPELATSIHAALSGAPGIALGNVVGSNVANPLLVLALGALVLPVASTPQALARDGSVLLGTTALLVGLAHLDAIGRAAGLGLVGLLAAYVAWTYRTEQAGTAPAAENDLRAAQAASRPPMGIGLWGDLAVAAAGLGLVLVGARLLVGSAVSMAQSLGVSETAVGLTVVAVGTSLPELAAGLAAAWKRQGDVLLGNIVGSNIFNVLGILGMTALVAPIPVDPAIARRDAWAAAAASLLLVFFARTGWRIGRREAGVLLAGYAAYLRLVFG
jgi:cation:H+ antiporter